MTPSRELVIWEGEPVRIFPAGEHVFPADAGALRELVDALRADLAQTQYIDVADVRAAQAQDAIAPTHPLAVPRLLDFLARHRPAFDRRARDRVVANTRAYGRARLDQLRALNAPDAILDHAVAALARVDDPAWAPTPALASLVPDVVATAAILDLDYRDPDELFASADLTALILLAAQACTRDAPAVDEAPAAWTPLVEPHEAQPRPGTVLVCGVLNDERCDRLDYAITDDGAFLAVSIPRPDDEADEG